MNDFSFIALFVLLTIVTVIVPKSEVLQQQQQQDNLHTYYSKKYDHVQLDAILNNRRLVHLFGMCFLGKSACSPEGRELKYIIPSALKTSCEKCTRKQKMLAFQIINDVKAKYPELWRQLSEQWDPTGEYLIEFNQNVAADVSKINDIDSRFADLSGASAATATATFTKDTASSTTTAAKTPTPTSTSTSTPENLRPPRRKLFLYNHLRFIDRIGEKVLRTGSEIATVVFNGMSDIFKRKTASSS